MKIGGTLTLLSLVLFLLGGIILIAAWAYGGYILPRQPAPSSSGYDTGALYVEIAIWVVTAASAAVLAIKLWSKRYPNGR